MHLAPATLARHPHVHRRPAHGEYGRAIAAVEAGDTRPTGAEADAEAASRSVQRRRPEGSSGGSSRRGGRRRTSLCFSTSRIYIAAILNGSYGKKSRWSASTPSASSRSPSGQREVRSGITTTTSS